MTRPFAPAGLHASRECCALPNIFCATTHSNPAAARYSHDRAAHPALHVSLGCLNWPDTSHRISRRAAPRPLPSFRVPLPGVRLMVRTKPSRELRRRNRRLFCEALESRILMSYTWITECADTGNPTTNGTNLQNILNGTTKHGGVSLAYGDTIVLTAGAEYRKALVLTYIAGTGTITIESSTIWNTTNHDGAGTGIA